MEIVIKAPQRPCWKFTVDPISESQMSMPGNYATSMVYGNYRDADGDGMGTFDKVHLTPTPSNEDKVRRFIALGRLNNPDFPFVYKERDAD